MRIETIGEYSISLHSHNLKVAGSNPAPATNFPQYNQRITRSFPRVPMAPSSNFLVRLDARDFRVFPRGYINSASLCQALTRIPGRKMGAKNPTPNLSPHPSKSRQPHTSPCGPQHRQRIQIVNVENDHRSFGLQRIALRMVKVPRSDTHLPANLQSADIQPTRERT